MSSDEEQDFDERHGFWGEDGQWYERRDNEYTKDDHIYGVFAANSNRSNNRYNKKKYQNNKPIIDPQTSNLGFNFVKGGVQISKNVDTESATNNAKNSTNDKQSILTEWEHVQQQKRDLNSSHNAPQLGQHGLPQQLGKKTQKKKHKNTNPHNAIRVKRDCGYAAWTQSEKRSKFGGLSFAEKYLRKHGFKGRLGSAAQGIANPVKQATARKYNQGLGFNGIDAQQTQSQPKNVEQELQEIKKRTDQEKQNIAQQQKMWKIIENNDNNNDIYIQPVKKRKISYETASNYLKNDARTNVMEIYDYTGDNGVVITSSDKIGNGSENVMCGVFKHNVDKICDIIEEKLVLLRRERANLEQDEHSIKLQLDVLTKQKSIDKQRGSKLCQLKTLLDGLNGDEVSSDFMYAVFKEIQQKFYVEYLQYKLWKLVANIVFPQIKKELMTWKVVDGKELIAMLMKWKGLLSNNYNKRDVYNVLIADVIIPKIRRELYEWYPLEMEVNNTFVRFFKPLKDVLSMECYKTLLNIYIVPRLNHMFEEREINDVAMRQCIISWDFIFDIEDIDDVLGRNICKKMKRFWRKFVGKTETEHLLYISTLKEWECVLLNVVDTKTMDNIYNVILETIVLGKLGNILTNCVSKMDENKNECLALKIKFNFIHLWYLNDIFSKQRYLKLLKNGFFDKWLFLMHETLTDDSALDNIEFIWNNLFAIVKNELFGKQQPEKINNLLNCELIEKYLNCCLDIIHFKIERRKKSLPSFGIIKNILMESIMSKKDKKRLKKKNKKDKKNKRNENENEWINEYKNEMKNMQNVSIGIVELVEIKAQNLGIEFYLDFQKQNEGKKVYKFGKLSICFYDKSIFAKQGNEWKPVDIQDLIRMS